MSLQNSNKGIAKTRCVRDPRSQSVSPNWIVQMLQLASIQAWRIYRGITGEQNFADFECRCAPLMDAVLITLNEGIWVRSREQNFQMFRSSRLDFFRSQSLLLAICDTPGGCISTSLCNDCPMFRMDNEIRSTDLVLVEREPYDVRGNKCLIPSKPFEMDSNCLSDTRSSAVCADDIFRSHDPSLPRLSTFDS